LQISITNLKPDEVKEATKLMLEALKHNYITDEEIEMRIALDETKINDEAGKIIANNLKNLMNDDNAAVLAARDGKKLVGYAVATAEGEMTDFWDIVVSREYRKKGVGTMLIREIENFARRKGCKFIRLNVNEKNRNAMKLYRKLGYRKISYIMIKGDLANGLP